eukprot:3068809-Karenia_brevis.AAC.1
MSCRIGLYHWLREWSTVAVCGATVQQAAEWCSDARCDQLQCSHLSMREGSTVAARGAIVQRAAQRGAAA